MEEQFDVFLSHNSKDKISVEELALTLRERGINVWFDKWQLVPGLPWQAAIEEGILKSKSIAVLVGSEGLGAWEVPETRAAISEAVRRKVPIIPVLLPKAPSTVELPIFLKGFTWVDMREGFSNEAIDHLIWGITGKFPGKEEKVTSYDPRRIYAELNEVFNTVGLPKYTYVEPEDYSKVAYNIKHLGKHIVIEGPSGVGKTCLIYRILDELGYELYKDFIYKSARLKQDKIEIPELVKVIKDETGPKIVIIDDVHMLDSEIRKELADQLKVLSDYVFTNKKLAKFILIGIPTVSSNLLYNAADLGPRIRTFKLSKAKDRQLEELIREGEKRLSIKFLRHQNIIKESYESFYLCQYICHEICFNNQILETQPELVEVNYQIELIRTGLVDDLSDRYENLLINFCKGMNWKIDKDHSFLALLACLSRIPKSVIHLNEIFIEAGPYSRAIAAIKNNINDVLRDSSGGDKLQKFLHYDEDLDIFSVEDPTFRYYLTHMDMSKLIDVLGCHDEKFIAHFITRETINTPSDHQMDETIIKSSQSTRDQVFISYSHKNAEWMEKLMTHLKPLVRKGTISAWTDTQISAGSRWYSEMKKALSSAKVGVLLVSPEFLASDFIEKEELSHLLEGANNDEITIIWIPISYSLYTETEIAKYQAAYDPSNPLDSLTSSEQNAALVEISLQIKQAITEIEEQEGDTDMEITTKIKILFLSANPSDQARLQTDKEHRIIKSEMERGRHRDFFEFLPSQFAVTITELLRAMNDKPDIVHFSGHGETKGIVISTDNNETQIVPIRALRRLFAPLKGITKIALLNSCYSAEQAKIISEYGMFVIGMNLPVGDEAAISFAKGLYNGLGEGKAIEAAYNDAMIVLETENPDYAEVVEVWQNGEKLNL